MGLSEATDPEDRASRPAQVEVFDVAVIGAGVAGTSAASVLSRAGLRTVLIDFRDRHPAEFRAEKIGQRQIDFLEAFGLGNAARAQMTAFDGVWVHRFNRIVEKTDKREYASAYGDLVNALRDALPEAVDRITARIAWVRTGDDRQQVGLGDGRVLNARLLVVATGLGDSIRRELGIERVVKSAGHSTSLGFDLANPASDFPFASLVWITERPSDRTAYITLFPMGGGMRANLFVYRPLDDPWCRAFRASPDDALSRLFPRFGTTFTPMRTDGEVQIRPIDIAQVKNHRQPGVVLVGDAFFTTCPVSGTGMDKALNDVDRLRHLVPEWLKTPGMSTEKINAFYDDPEKLRVDSESLSLSMRERAVRMDPSFRGTYLRVKRNLLRRAAYHLRDALAQVRGSRPDRPRKGAEA